MPTLVPRQPLTFESAGRRRTRIPRSRRSALLLGLVALLVLQLLSACSAPVRAPVSSREQPAQHTGVRPAYYQIARGDTLYSIAWRYGLEFRRLATWNRLRAPYIIYPGQRLRLSPPPVTSRSKRRTPVRARPVVKKAAPVKRAPPPRPRSGTARSTAAKAGAGKGVKSGRLSWRWPTRGRVTQKFVRGDPLHKGVKISGRLGQPVVAAEAGSVVYAGSGLIGYGRLIIIKHNKNYLSAYGHNRRILVGEGDKVARGERIAEMGKNGSGGAMLHFEIRRNGAPVDPLRLLPRSR